MNKIIFAVYPAVAILSLAAAFSAHAQSVNDPADHAAYGGMRAEGSTGTVAQAIARSSQRASLLASRRTARDTDPIDHAAYGAMPAPVVSLRSRAEVRAEAIVARDAGYEANWREGGDPQHAIVTRARTTDTAHVLAAAPAKRDAR